MKSSKKGELLVTKTLITVILLIVGFAVVLFIFYQLSWSGMVDREVCHQSVIYRATLPSFAGAKEYVPLKCKTQKMCITTGIIGGDCEEEFGKDSVMKVKVKNEEQISRAIADEIIDCWSTMGEGKVSIFSQWLAESYGIGGVYPSCVICSRIAFDNKLGEKGIDLEKVNVLDYMMRYKPKGREVTYYDYLLGESARISVGELFKETSDEEANARIGELREIEEKVGDFEQKDFGIENVEDPEKLNEESDELAVIFMQISSPSHREVFINTLKAGAAFLGGIIIYKPGAFFSTKAAGSSSKIITGGRLLTPLTKFVIAVGVIIAGVQQGNVALNREVTAGYCGDVSYGDEAREGCSVVRTINYDKQEISQYCSVIESIN